MLPWLARHTCRASPSNIKLRTILSCDIVFSNCNLARRSAVDTIGPMLIMGIKMRDVFMFRNMPTALAFKLVNCVLNLPYPIRHRLPPLIC